MNNSLARLYEGMAAALGERVLPHIDDDFARGQVYGVIYLLQCLNLRTDWSDAYLRPQWEALRSTGERLKVLLHDVPGAPDIEASNPEEGTLHQRCEAMRSALCATYDWTEHHAAELPLDVANAVRAAWQGFIETDLKHELSQRASLPYSEMSTGHSTTAPGEKGTS